MSFKILSRWNGDRSDPTKPIKFTLVTFNADVPANARRSIAWRWSTAGGSLSASQDSTSITVTTGPATSFRIKKTAFTLFDSVTVNGANVATLPGRIDMMMASGSTITPVPSATTLEEYNGPNTVRAVVMQQGALGQLRYTCRWTFHSGRSDVTVDFRLENPNPYGIFDPLIPDGQQYVEKLYLVQPLAARPQRGLDRGHAQSRRQRSLRSETELAGGPESTPGRRFHVDRDADGLPVGTERRTPVRWTSHRQAAAAR